MLVCKSQEHFVHISSTAALLKRAHFVFCTHLQITHRFYKLQPRFNPISHAFFVKTSMQLRHVQFLKRACEIQNARVFYRLYFDKIIDHLSYIYQICTVVVWVTLFLRFSLLIYRKNVSQLTVSHWLQQQVFPCTLA